MRLSESSGEIDDLLEHVLEPKVLDRSSCCWRVPCCA